MPSFPNLSAQFKGSLSRYAIVSLVLILFGQLSSFWIIIRVLRRNLSERPILVSWWYLPLGLTKVTLDGPMHDARGHSRFIYHCHWLWRCCQIWCRKVARMLFLDYVTPLPGSEVFRTRASSRHDHSRTGLASTICNPICSTSRPSKVRRPFSGVSYT